MIKKAPKDIKTIPIIDYSNNINFIRAKVDMKLMLAYNIDISIKNKLLVMIDIAVMSSTICVEK